jgi:hypothetical protein
MLKKSNLTCWYREQRMKTTITIFAFLLFLTLGAGGIFAKEPNPAGLLPAVVAQSCGQANTVTMWHDINDDG